MSDVVAVNPITGHTNVDAWLHSYAEGAEPTWKDRALAECIKVLHARNLQGALERLDAIVPDDVAVGGVLTLGRTVQDAQEAHSRPDAAPARVSMTEGEPCPECQSDDTSGEQGTGSFECHHCGYVEADFMEQPVDADDGA